MEAFSVFLSEEAREPRPPGLDVGDVGVGAGLGEIEMAGGMVAELMAAREPAAEDRAVAVALDVPPDHQPHGVDAMFGEGREQAVGDPRPLGRIGVEIAARDRQVVDGDQEWAGGPRVGSMEGGSGEQGEGEDGDRCEHGDSAHAVPPYFRFPTIVD